MFRKAVKTDVPVLEQLLTSAWRQTYCDVYTTEYIERVIEDFYNPVRLMDEVTHTSKEWSGYYIYEISGKVVGCIGGGIEEDGVGSIYVLYLDPAEKRKGYGSQLLQHFTTMQKQSEGIVRQSVSVAESNQMGLPFYEKMGFVEEIKQRSWNALENENYQTVLLTREV